MGAPANRANVGVTTVASNASNGYIPRQDRVTVNSTNYDRRMPVDIYGNPVNNQPMVRRDPILWMRVFSEAEEGVSRFPALQLPCQRSQGIEKRGQRGRGVAR